MKKIMIACVAVAMAAVAQAASINWTIGNVYSPSDPTTKVAAGSMSAWLFVTANSTDVTTGIPVTTLAAVQAVLDSGDLTGLSLGSQVESIGGYAFYDCKMISGELVLPKNLKMTKS